MSDKREVRRPTAIEFGIALVAARSWPEKKIREKILARYDEDEAEEALARLRALRLVDDAGWAERFARERFERGGKGRNRIRMELVSRGIGGAAIDAALAAVFEGDAERDAEREKAVAVLESLRRTLGRATRSPHAEAETDAEADTASLARERAPLAVAGQQTEGAAAGSSSPRGVARKRAPSAEVVLKNRLFRRMLARGYPASLVRDLLDVS